MNRRFGGTRSPSPHLSLLAWAWLSAATTLAAVPVLEHLYPAGGVPGSTNAVTVSGKFEPWPVQAWVEGGGVSFVARTNSGKFDVEIAAGALPGPRFVRLFNPEGASEPRLFVVGDGREIGESEPNDRTTAPQAVANLPVTVNGRLDRNGDVDSFAVNVRAGEWLEAFVDAYTLMSKLDAVLRVVGTNGVQLAWNHDFVTFDPRISWQSPADQTVVVQVFGFRYPADSSVTLAGGEGMVYRLHLGTSIHAPDFCPPGAAEVEPNDRAKDAGALPADGRVVGTISPGPDEDRFRITGVKDQVLSLGVEAASWGSPLDAWLRIEETDGKELAFNDDSENSRDPRLDWKAPRDGAWIVAVGSRTHRGGPDHRYRLSVRPALPEVQAWVTASAFALEAGTTNEVKATVTRRHGFTNAVQLAFRDLPEGVTAGTVEAPAGDGEATLKLVAAPTAAAFNAPVGLVLIDAKTRQEQAVMFDLASRGENNGVPQGWSKLLRERTERLWLTVRPKAIEKK